MAESEDIEEIMAELRKFPDKEFYPGFFREVRDVQLQLAMRAVSRNRPQRSGALQERRDLSLKAHLIQQWRRRQRRLEQSSDNPQPEP